MPCIQESKKLDISKCPRIGCPNYLSEHELKKIPSNHNRRSRHSFCKKCRSVWLHRTIRVRCVICKDEFQPHIYTRTSCDKCNSPKIRTHRYHVKKFGEPKIPKSKKLLELFLAGEILTYKQIKDTTGLKEGSIKQFISAFREKGHNIKCQVQTVYFIPKE